MKKVLSIILIGLLLMNLSAAICENNKVENYTRYAAYEPQANTPIGMIPGSDHSILVVWFSRPGNTAFDQNVDAVSQASLQLNNAGELTGNSQMVAEWIADETDADRFLIQTAYTYPQDVGQLVKVGEGQDIDSVTISLASHLEELSGYDTVWLVSPVWHYTICTPMRMFLQETDLSGKTVYVVTTHMGSGFADIPQKVSELYPDANVIRALAIPGNSAAEHQDEVVQYVQNTRK